MAFNLENMTIDYKKMLRMIPSDRTTLAQSGAISDLISSLTPGQLVNLFPRYYRDKLPDVGEAVSSLGGALSDSARYVGGGGGGGGGGGDGGGGGSAPNTPPKLTVEEQTAMLLKVGIDVSDITGSIGSEGLSIDDERLKALKNLTDNQLASSGLQKVQTEDGKTLIKKVAPEALQLSDEAALDKFKKTFPPTTFSPRERATLDFIAKREGSSDPDVVFGGERYKERLGLDKKPLTEHTISEVINVIMPRLRELSKDDGYGRRDDGKLVGTSAVGSGQMIEGTLIANLRALGIPEDQWDELKLDKDLQERLTLQNFKSSGIGDPNAPPSTWDHRELGDQYESLNQGRRKPGMTQAEASEIENASPERPKNPQEDISPQEAKQKLAELEIQQEQQSLTQTLFDQTQTQVAQSGSLGKFEQQGSNDQFGITGTASQRGLEEVDSRLVDIMKKATEEFPLRGRLFSGKRDDDGGHGKGLATDMEIFDESGRPLGSYKSPQTANIYAMFALKAREIQMRDYPELADDFVWGGGFAGMVQGGESGGKYGAADFMDFRIGHSKQSAMKAFKWPSGDDPGGWQTGYEQYTEGDFLGIGHRTPTPEDFEKLQGFKLTQEQDAIQRQIALRGGYNAGLLGHENIGERQPSQTATYIPSQTDDIQNAVPETQTASPQKTMVISLGTNDWADPSKTYDNAKAVIKSAQAKGYKVVIVPPINAKVGETDISGASAEVRRAALEAGVEIEEVQDWSGTGGYHPSNEEAKRIAAKYPGQTFVGDSIANQIGTFAENGTKVATDGINTNTILENINSDQVAALELAPEAAPIPAPEPTLVQAGFSDPVTVDPVTVAQSNVVPAEPEQPQAETTLSVPSFINGGTVPMPPGENMAAYSTETGKLQFVSNDRELYTKDDQGNLRIDPSTIRQEDQKAQVASAEPQRAEPQNQPMQYRPQQPLPVSTPDPNFLETMSSGSMASSPSQLRALNRAKLYSENSSSLVNGHFS